MPARCKNYKNKNFKTFYNTGSKSKFQSIATEKK